MKFHLHLTAVAVLFTASCALNKKAPPQAIVPEIKKEDLEIVKVRVQFV